ncbi:MAG: HAAS signaling domain-containing protein [Phycicoccus sp.]
MTGLDHPLVQAYLAHLDTLTDGLSPGRRAELRADLEEHFAEALPEAADEDAVTRVLARLGTPEEVVAEAAGTRPPTDTRTIGDGGAPRVEQAAVITSALSVAATLSVVLLMFAPFLWLGGVVLTLFSRRWSAGDKALAVVTYGVLGFPLLAASTTFAVRGATDCFGDIAPVGVPVEPCTNSVDPRQHVAVLVVGGIVLLTLWVWAGVHLWRRARRAAPAEEAHVIRMR